MLRGAPFTYPEEILYLYSTTTINDDTLQSPVHAVSINSEIHQYLGQKIGKFPIEALVGIAHGRTQNRPCIRPQVLPSVALYSRLLTNGAKKPWVCGLWLGRLLQLMPEHASHTIGMCYCTRRVPGVAYLGISVSLFENQILIRSDTAPIDVTCGHRPCGSTCQ